MCPHEHCRCQAWVASMHCPAVGRCLGARHSCRQGIALVGSTWGMGRAFHMLVTDIRPAISWELAVPGRPGSAANRAVSTEDRGVCYVTDIRVTQGQ